MSPVEISLCFNAGQKTEYLSELIKSAGAASLARQQMDVHPMLWEDYKQEITSMALCGRGSDVSQVGFPLTDDLSAMNALAPISAQILAKVGGAEIFHPAIWKMANRHETGRIWGLPWLVDPRALFYWKDLVESAKLEAETAFQTAESMEAACQQIQNSGVASPWVLGMADKFVIIHSVVSWVWGKGGDFISPEGNRAVFLEPAALDGLEAYFRLSRYMPDAGRPLSVAEAQQLFVERKAAITMGPYGSLNSFLAAVPPEMRGLLGVALPPGPPLIAGSDLVYWRHSRKDQEVFKLFETLFNTEIQIKYAEYLGDLPVTMNALEHLAKSTDPNVRTFVATLDKGRIFATTKFAGILEVQLGAALAGLWAEYSAQPADNLRDRLRTALGRVNHRFDMMHAA